MTKHHIKHITLFLIISFFLLFSVLSISYAVPQQSVSISINEHEPVKQVVKKLNHALVKKGYKLKEGDAEYIHTIVKKGKKKAEQKKVEIRLVCTFKPLKCRIIVTASLADIQTPSTSTEAISRQ